MFPIPAPQAYLPPLICLGFIFIFYKLLRGGKIEERFALGGGAFFLFLFFLLLFQGIREVRFLGYLRNLPPEEVRAVSFFDLERGHYAFGPGDPDFAKVCLEIEITDRAKIREIVQALGNLTPYAPNHEGPHQSYVVRVDRTSGDPFWFVLGHGTRRNRQTAWIEFNSNITGGWHSGVYLSPPLYKLLTTGPGLAKWKSFP